jgi:hypothetical protein
MVSSLASFSATVQQAITCPILLDLTCINLNIQESGLYDLDD